jgi:hypothetical protein
MTKQTLLRLDRPVSDGPHFLGVPSPAMGCAGGLGHFGERQPLPETRPSLPSVMESLQAARGLGSVAPTLEPGLGRTVARGRSLLGQGQVVATMERLTLSAGTDEALGEIPYVALLRQLIEHEQVPAARRLLQAIPLSAQDDPVIRKLRSVLSLPVVRRSPRRDTDRSREYDWLRREGHRYRGQWVALDASGLVASSPTLRGLQDKLKDLRLAGPPLLHRLE